MKTHYSWIGAALRWAGVVIAAAGLFAPWQAVAQNPWTPLKNLPPGGAGIGTMLLLSDGTVMAHQAPGGTNWYKLSPDSQGHYVNGQWTNRGSMTYTRQYFSSTVLRDGRVMVAGAEYGTGWNTAEVYSPFTDSWTPVSVPSSLLQQNNTVNPTTGANSAGFMDSGCVLLPDGKVLISPVNPGPPSGTVIFDPVLNTFSAGPILTNANANTDEQSWVKLPDDSILTFDSSLQSQRFIPSLNQWITDTNLPVQLYDAFGGEIGAGFLLPNGRAFYLGANGNTVLYVPTGDTNQGSWIIGPPITNSQAAPDAAAAMMANGKILCAVSPVPTSKPGLFTVPTTFYEYDYSVGSIGSFTQVKAPNGTFTNAGPTYNTRMLDLPDGTVLFTDGNSQLYVYQPTTPPIAAGKPVISFISQNGDGSYHLTGTGLNGISQGASYGDDAQMDSNYPLVQVTDGAGNVFYVLSYGWSSTGVRTGNAQVSTEFVTGLAPGAYAVRVVVNGNSSDPYTIYGPVWVDFNVAFPGAGTFISPYSTLALGIANVPVSGSIFLKGPRTSHETMTINKAMSIVALGGPVTIGH